MIEKRYAVAWSEVVWFVECPYCGHSHNLGDTKVDQDSTETCEDEECGKKFIMGPGYDDE